MTRISASAGVALPSSRVIWRFMVASVRHTVASELRGTRRVSLTMLNIVLMPMRLASPVAPMQSVPLASLT